VTNPDRLPVPEEYPDGGTEVDPADLYARLRSVGQEHGPAFRSVTEVRVSPDGTVTAALRLPMSASAGRRELRIHPVLLDGALQLLGATTQASSADPAGPAGSAEPSFAVLPGSDRPDRRPWGCAVGDPSLRRAAADRRSRPVRAHVSLADAQGTTVLRATGIEIIRLGQGSSQVPAAPVYNAVWHEAPSPSPAGAHPGRRFILVAEDAADPMVALLRDRLPVDVVAASDSAALRVALRTPARAVVLLAAGATRDRDDPGSALQTTAQTTARGSAGQAEWSPLRRPGRAGGRAA